MAALGKNLDLSQFNLPLDVQDAMKAYILAHLAAEAWALYTSEQKDIVLSVHKKIAGVIPINVTVRLEDLDGVIEPVMVRFFGPPPQGTPGVPASHG